MGIVVRAVEAADRPAWDRLWAGYLAFYRHDLPPEVTERTWAQLLDPAGALHGLVAVGDDGAVIGFSHRLYHASTWALTGYCYLEDLFVAPEARRSGAGRALVEATAAAAADAGAEKLYWHTDRPNATARALYDQLAVHEGFIVYERTLAAPAGS